MYFPENYSRRVCKSTNKKILALLYLNSFYTDEQHAEFENNYPDEDESVSEYCLNEETTEQDNKAEGSHDQTGESHEDDMFYRNSNVSEIIPSTVSATTTSVQDVIKGTV